MVANQLKTNGCGVLLPVLKRIVAVVGSVSVLSRLIRTNRSAMYMWDQVPDDLVIPIEQAQRDALRRKERELREARKNFTPRHKIRPDLFPQKQRTKSNE